MASVGKLVRYSIDDGIATLTMNRPERLNAFTVEMIQEWDVHLGKAINNDAVRVIVLTGAGRGFCAGGDIDEIVDISRLNATGRKNYLWNERVQHRQQARTE